MFLNKKRTRFKAAGYRPDIYFANAEIPTRIAIAMLKEFKRLEEENYAKRIG